MPNLTLRTRPFLRNPYIYLVFVIVVGVILYSLKDLPTVVLLIALLIPPFVLIALTTETLKIVDDAMIREEKLLFFSKNQKIVIKNRLEIMRVFYDRHTKNPALADLTYMRFIGDKDRMDVSTNNYKIQDLDAFISEIQKTRKGVIYNSEWIRA